MRTTVVAALALLAAGCGQAVSGGAPAPDPRSSNASSGPGAWVRLADSPLAPRQGPAVASVGGEVVVVGGYAGPPCPPTADCSMPPDALQRDGAAYDLETGAWRRIADAPRPVPDFASTAVLGRSLYVVADEALLVWDSRQDSWRELAVPGGAPGGLVADGDRLLVVPGSDETGERPDLALDPSSGTWSRLPADPLSPAFDRAIAATPAGLVLTAKSIGPDGGPADPALVRAALLAPGARHWRTLPDSDQLGGWRWSWTGHRLVDASLGGADGGEVDNYGRVIPFGGRLDPATGTWSHLPEAPDEGGGGWPVDGPNGPVTAADGWLYDDGAESWTRLARPAGAPEQPGPAVWAGDRLVVIGGEDWNLPDDAEANPDDVWSTGVWAYRWTP